MDFKSLITKISAMDDKIETIAAPELPKAIQLNEDAELRVLAGTSTYIAEAKKKAEIKESAASQFTPEMQARIKKATPEELSKMAYELAGEGGPQYDNELKMLQQAKAELSGQMAESKVKEEMKVGDKKPSSTGGTIEKTATGIKHHAGKNYGGSSAPKDDDEDDDAPKAKKKAKKESIDPEFKSKFMKMVEAKKEESDKKKADKKKKMEEGAKPDFLDLDKDGNKKEPMKSAAKSKGGDKKDGKKGMSAKQAKYFGKKEESVKVSKKVVAESVEQTLTFKDMVKLVQESGGQQQIDPIDTALFNWATRVAHSKLGEGVKADLYAGLIYERNGGRFEMYDVLSEDQK